jgi:hypothetical protein
MTDNSPKFIVHTTNDTLIKALLVHTPPVDSSSIRAQVIHTPPAAPTSADVSSCEVAGGSGEVSGGTSSGATGSAAGE